LSDYRLELHSGKTGLNYLFDDWLALAKNLTHSKPSHFPYLYAAFINRPDAHDKHITFVAIYRDSQLAAIFPVGCKQFRRFNLVELSIPVAEELDIFPDVILGVAEDSAAVFKFFLKAMRAQKDMKWDVLVVRNTLSNSHISNCIQSSKHILSKHEFSGHCNYIKTEQFRDQQTFLSKNFRSNLRKARNLLDKAGKAEFECVSDFSSVIQAFKIFVDLEASGWKGETRHDKQHYYAGSAMKLNKSKLSFHRDLVSAFASHGCVEIYNLLLNGEVIGTNLGIVINNTCYLLKIAYNETYAKLSPGTLLLEWIIQHHIQGAKVSTINLVSDYQWHKVWKPSQLNYASYQCFNSTWKGTAYGISKYLQSVLRRLKNPTEKSSPGCQ